MAVRLTTLREYPALRDVPDAALTATLAMWDEVTVAPGNLLWRRGGQADGVALLLEGAVSVRHGRVQLGEAGPGECLGFAPALLRDVRRGADVVAQQASRLLTLSTSHLLALRSQHNPVYLALLDDGVRTLAKHSRQTDARIAELRTGTFAEVEAAPQGLLHRVWRSIRPPKVGEPCPPLVPLLRAQPGLRDVPEAVLGRLAASFRGLAVPEREVLIREGDVRSTVLLLASGSVDIMRRASSGSLLLGRVHPGAVLGVLALVEGGPRTASCVTSTPAWVYEMRAEDLAALAPELRTVWIENMLVILYRQLRAANAALMSASKVFSGGRASPTPADSMIELLTAWGALEAAGAGEADADEDSWSPAGAGEGEDTGRANDD